MTHTDPNWLHFIEILEKSKGEIHSSDFIKFFVTCITCTIEIDRIFNRYPFTCIQIAHLPALQIDE